MKTFFEMLDVLESSEARGTRMEAGLRRESDIIQAIINDPNLGWQFAGVTHKQDRAGTDAVIITTRPSKFGLPPKSRVQIKARTGDDILVETIAPFTEAVREYAIGKTEEELLQDRNLWTGKDLRAQSDFYIVLGANNRTLIIRRTDEIKKIAKALTAKFLKTKYTDKIVTPLGKAEYINDPAEGTPKVLTFIDESVFQKNAYNFNVNLKNPVL